MVFITGGTGFVGTHLIDRLLKEKETVVCMAAPFERESAEELRKKGCEIVYADILEKNEVVKALLPEVKAVVHLVGVLTETKKLKFRDIHVRATRNVVTACMRKDVKRLIFTSAFGAAPYAKSSNHRSKWECEEIIKSSGLEYTIFRPTIIFGRGDRFTSLFADEIKKHRLIPMPDGGRNRVQPIFVEDLVSAIARSIVRDDTRFREYDLGGHEVYTFRELVDRIEEAVNLKRRKVPVPIPLLYLLGWLYEIFREKPRLTRDLVTLLTMDYVAPGNAITTAFGIDPAGFAEGMSTYLQEAPPFKERPRKAA